MRMFSCSFKLCSETSFRNRYQKDILELPVRNNILNKSKLKLATFSSIFFIVSSIWGDSPTAHLRNYISSSNLIVTHLYGLCDPKTIAQYPFWKDIEKLNPILYSRTIGKRT